MITHLQPLTTTKEHIDLVMPSNLPIMHPQPTSTEAKSYSFPMDLIPVAHYIGP